MHFESAAEVVEHCKEKGLMLWVEPEPNEPRFQAHPDSDGSGHFRLVSVRTERKSGVGLDGIHQGDTTDFTVSERALSEMNEQAGNDRADVRRISNRSINRAFIYLDISDFSTLAPGKQVLVINDLSSQVLLRAYLDHDIYQGQRDVSGLESQICIGDGYILVYRDAALAAKIACSIAADIDVRRARKWLSVPFHYRMSVHWGPVYSFFDPGRKDWNYVGSGINDGHRVLEAIGSRLDDVVYISESVRDEILRGDTSHAPLSGMHGYMTNEGRSKDKHGIPRRLYRMDHTAVAKEHIDQLNFCLRVK